MSSMLVGRSRNVWWLTRRNATMPASRWLVNDPLVDHRGTLRCMAKENQRALLAHSLSLRDCGVPPGLLVGANLSGALGGRVLRPLPPGACQSARRGMAGRP
jgi:hypothetical protein